MKRFAWVVALLVSGLTSQNLRGQEPAAAPENLKIPAIIKDVKASQDWLTHVKSFRVMFDDGSEMAFDDKRIYRATVAGGGLVNGNYYWDGKVAARNLREGYAELTESSETVLSSFMGNTLWGRNGQTYWFTPARGLMNDLIGSPDRYKLMGREEFHGVDCYVLAKSRADDKLYVGIADHREYGIAMGANDLHWYTDYKEVAPGCWYPMTQGDQAGTRHVVEVVVDQPLPESLFAKAFKDGTHIHQLVDGLTLDYVYRADQSPDEMAEIRLDGERRKVYGPPPMRPGAVRLSTPVAPLPLNPLAVNPAAEFPQDAKWFNGGPLKLGELRGKIVLVVFWATWSDARVGLWGTPAPLVDLTLLEPVKQDVVVIGVHVPTNESARVEKAIKEMSLSIPVCIDVPMAKEPAWGTMADRYRLDELPTTYVIDPDGRIAALGNWPEAVGRVGELLGKPLGKK